MDKSLYSDKNLEDSPHQRRTTRKTNPGAQILTKSFNEELKQDQERAKRRKKMMEDLLREKREIKRRET